VDGPDHEQAGEAPGGVFQHVAQSCSLERHERLGRSASQVRAAGTQLVGTAGRRLRNRNDDLLGTGCGNFLMTRISWRGDRRRDGSHRARVLRAQTSADAVPSQ
jgi:hypothetical protein